MGGPKRDHFDDLPARRAPVVEVKANARKEDSANEAGLACFDDDPGAGGCGDQLERVSEIFVEGVTRFVAVVEPPLPAGADPSLDFKAEPETSSCWRVLPL